MNNGYVKNQYTISTDVLIEISTQYLINKLDIKDRKEIAEAVDNYIDNMLNLDTKKISTEEIRDLIYMNVINSLKEKLCQGIH